jgi:hypothetical protein
VAFRYTASGSQGLALASKADFAIEYVRFLRITEVHFIFIAADHLLQIL